MEEIKEIPPIFKIETKEKKKKWTIKEEKKEVNEEIIFKDEDINNYKTHTYSTIKILVCQTFAKNIENVSKDIDNELSNYKNERKPDFIIFPECYIASLVNLESDTLSPISKIVKKHGVYAILGSMPEISENKKFITSILMNRNGTVVGKYRKRNLTNFSTMSAGNQPGIFETEFGRIAILICFDIENHEILQETLLYNPKIIFNPTYISKSNSSDDYQSWTTSMNCMSDLFEKKALDNNISILRCDYPSGGTSQLITPNKTQTISSFTNTSEIFYIEKEMNILSKICIKPLYERSKETDNIGVRYHINTIRTKKTKKIEFINNILIVLKETETDNIMFYQMNSKVIGSITCKYNENEFLFKKIQNDLYLDEESMIDINEMKIKKVDKIKETINEEEQYLKIDKETIQVYDKNDR
jgi:predicted amidohydrolase